MASGLGSTYFVGPNARGDRLWFAGGEDLGRGKSFGATATRLVPDGADRVRAEALWSARFARDGRVFATPLLWEGRLWVLQETGDLTVLDADTGATVATTRMPQSARGGFYSSLIAADGRVWFGTESGDLVAVRLSLQDVLEVDVRPLEAIRSTPVFVGTRVYVRSLKSLWAFGP